MTEQQQSAEAIDSPPPSCPTCDGAMWDNRVGKRNPKAPDFKCKDKECDGVIWPLRSAVPASPVAASPPSASGAPQPPASGMPACPICGGAMWDDRTSKRNPRAPDFKCKNKPKERGGPGCEGVIWPSRDGSSSPYPASAARRPDYGGSSPFDDATPSTNLPPFNDAPPHDDDLPF